MPTPLIIILSIVAVFVFLLCMQVRICADFDGEFKFTVKYLFLSFRLKNKAEGKTKQKKEKQKEKNRPKKINLEQIKYFIDLFEKLFEKVKPLLNKLRKSLIVNKLIVDLVVSTDDAAMTAIYYGEACAAVFPVVSFLESAVKIRKKQVSIKCDFNGASSLNFHVDVGIRVASAIAIGIAGFFKVISILIKNPIHFKKGDLKHE